MSLLEADGLSQFLRNLVQRPRGGEDRRADSASSWNVM
jgi:hypothetical protein